MGEKPLTTDEALPRAALVGGGPLGGVDTPPPGMAAGGINTTRSNIKNSGAMSAGPARGATKAQGAVLDAAPRDGEIVEDLDPMAGAAATESINTTRSNIKSSGAMSAGPAGGGDAVDSDPIPGIDVKLGKNPGGGAISGLPPDLQPTPTRPPDPIREPGTRPGQGAAAGGPAGAGAGSPAGDQAGAGDVGAIAESSGPKVPPGGTR